MSIVRDATPVDIPALLDMLRVYRRCSPFDFLKDADDPHYVTGLISEIIAGRGIALVSETDHITGMLIASIAPSMWSPCHLVMTEMAFWVNPNDRGGTSAYRLVAEYVKRGKTLKQQGRISAFFISKTIDSPSLKYDRFGFSQLEEFWII